MLKRYKPAGRRRSVTSYHPICLRLLLPRVAIGADAYLGEPDGATPHAKPRPSASDASVHTAVINVGRTASSVTEIVYASVTHMPATRLAPKQAASTDPSGYSDALRLIAEQR